MKQLTIFGAYGLAISTLILSCKKAETLSGQPTQALNAKITINTPYENQVFNTGDTVFVKAFVTCSTEMHGCHVYIISNNTDTLFTKAQHTHGNEMMVSEQWINNLGTSADLQVIVSAVIDHDGTTADKSLSFKTQ